MSLAKFTTDGFYIGRDFHAFGFFIGEVVLQSLLGVADPSGRQQAGFVLSVSARILPVANTHPLPEKRR